MADADNADALGVDGLSTELTGSQACGGNLQCFTYTQMIENLPVHGSTVKALIRTGSTDRMAHVGARIIANPGGALPSDVYSAAQAESAIESAYPDIDTFDTATKVVYQSDDGVYHRAWRIYGSDDEGEVGPYLFFVDTASNAIVGTISMLAHSGPVSGTVSGYRIPGTNAAETAQSTTIPGAKVRVLDHDGSPGCASASGTGEILTCEDDPGCGSDGYFEFDDVPESYDMVTSALEGPWASIRDCTGLGHGCPPVFQSCVGISSTRPLSNLSITYPSSGSPSEAEIAGVNAWFAVNATHDWITTLLPEFTALDFPMPTSINPLGFVKCNAGYGASLSPGATGIYFPASGVAQIGGRDRTCRNSAYSRPYITHEYGHAIHHRILGHYDHEPDWGEGIADTIGALTWDTEYIAQGLFDEPDLPDADNFLRRVDEPDVRYVAPYGLPPWCNEEYFNLPRNFIPHCYGLAIAGAFWDLRESLLHCAGSPTTPCSSDDDCEGIGDEYCSDGVTERLFADYLCCSTGQMDSSVLTAVLSVDDDDDDDISNGTDHSPEILAAFAKHGWTNNPSEIEVTWEGPQPDPGPIEGTDYTVDYQCDPPCITLITTEKIENSQPVEVRRWIIGRVDQVTSSPLDIGRIDAAWDGTAHNVTIQVGSDPQVSAIHQCANVHIVNPSRQSGSHWTSLDLQLAGSLVGLGEAFPTSTSGGRVRGTIAGSAAQIDAYAVGIGENQAGTLSVGAELTALNVTVLPDTAGGPSKIEADSIGAVFVDANIDGDVLIRGDSAGSLLANADENGSGNLAGEVTANRGDFNGNVCGDNLESWEPTDSIPSNLNVIWGPSGTICGNIVCPAASAPDGPEEEPSGTNKNRYISFVVPEGVGDDIAIRVRLRSLNNGDPDFVPFQGQVRYLNELLDAQQDPIYECDETAAGAAATFKCATLGCEPQYRDWETLGEGDVWHVKSDAIAPDSIYDVEIIRRGASDGAQCPSVARLEARTGPWGDADSNGTTNVNDIAAVVNTLKGPPNTPLLTYAKADLSPDFRPNQGLTVLSIASVVDALKNIPYEQSSDPPVDCQ